MLFVIPSFEQMAATVGQLCVVPTQPAWERWFLPITQQPQPHFGTEHRIKRFQWEGGRNGVAVVCGCKVS
jgi:hypothetical protein